jgi:rubrerythrin
MMNTNKDENSLTTLVKGELAAVETYKQALEKVDDSLAGAELRRIEGEHEEAVKVLRERLEALNLDVPQDSGLWGDWSKAVEGTAKVFGSKAAIKALKEGEKHGVHDYEDALRDVKLDAELRDIIRSRLLPSTKAHIPALEGLVSRVGK